MYGRRARGRGDTPFRFRFGYAEMDGTLRSEGNWCVTFD